MFSLKDPFMGRDDRARGPGLGTPDTSRSGFGLCESLPTSSGVAQGCRLALVSENESPAICSAKACRAFATWAVVWNNPRLHTPDREKVWVACGEHKQPLADYLAVRSFLKRVEPLGRSS